MFSDETEESVFTDTDVISTQRSGYVDKRQQQQQQQGLNSSGNKLLLSSFILLICIDKATNKLKSNMILSRFYQGGREYGLIVVDKFA